MSYAVLDSQVLYNTSAAWLDLSRGLANWRLWGRLGWQEIKRRYRRTVIGPFWTSISLAVLVLTLGSLGAGLWGEAANQYLPYLCSGLLVWLMIATMLIEGCNTYVTADAVIKQLRFDYSVLIFALVWRNLVVFGHNFTIFLLIAIFTGVSVNLNTLLVFPGMALLILNAVWVVALLGLLSLRFRDVQQVVATLVQIAMFVTPIFWPTARLEGARVMFIEFNPLYHWIIVVRSPLLGEVAPTNSYIAMALMIVCGWTITFLLYSRFRSRIAYWG